MKTGKLVWLMKGSPLYEHPSTSVGVTTRHFTGFIAEEGGRYAVEVQRVEELGVEHAGQHDPRMISWSQVLVDGQLVWTKTRLLTELQGAVGVPLW